MIESAGYEGEFASVRRPFAWTKGTYTYSITKGESETVNGKECTWFHCRVKDSAGAVQEVGSLRFEGTDFTFLGKALGICGGLQHGEDSEIRHSESQHHLRLAAPQRAEGRVETSVRLLSRSHQRQSRLTRLCLDQGRRREVRGRGRADLQARRDEAAPFNRHHPCKIDSIATLVEE